MPLIQKLALVNIGAGIAVLGLKYLAFVLTGSIALYSDALESIVNVGAAIGAFLAVRLSARPADENHPYGHHKVEYFAAVIEGVLIVIAAISIFRAAYVAYLDPIPLTAPVEGLLVNAAATLINGIWCWVLIRQGSQQRSPAIVADGKHLLTDVLSSAGVLLGVALVVATGWAVLDPILAALVALNILWSGWTLVKASVGGLMDEAVASDVMEQVRTLISTHATGALEAHDIRTRYAGRVTFIDFHLVVPGRMAVSDAHDICDRIEQAISNEIEGAITTIHVEPDDKAKHSGIVVH